MKNIIFRIFFVFYFLLFTFVSPCAADSLWNNKSESPYATAKARAVGDVVTIIILETTAAAQRAGTDTSVKDDLSADLSHTISSLAGASEKVKFKGENKYKGEGATSRSSDVRAKVASIVTRVLSNGNLEIRGKHKIKVNDETQQISIKGVIRPRDITAENTVYSYQVANADVRVVGTGTVGSAQQPSWVVRFFNWLF